MPCWLSWVFQYINMTYFLKDTEKENEACMECQVWHYQHSLVFTKVPAWLLAVVMLFLPSSHHQCHMIKVFCLFWNLNLPYLRVSVLEIYISFYNGNPKCHLHNVFGLKDWFFFFLLTLTSASIPCSFWISMRSL